jgi:hypothetical protein
VGIAVDGCAFPFRHDHGIYAGVDAVIAFCLHAVSDSPRRWRERGSDVLAFTVTAIMLIAPWAVFVHVNEGLVDYVRTRGSQYRKITSVTSQWSGDSPYRSLFAIDPVRILLALHVVRRNLGRCDSLGNGSLDIYSRVDLDEGIDWDYLRHLGSWRSPGSNGSVSCGLGRRLAGYHRRAAVPRAKLRPTRISNHAALATPFLADVGRHVSKTSMSTQAGLAVAMNAGRLAVAYSLCAITGVAALSCLQGNPLLERPTAALHALPDEFDRLLTSPPIDGFVTTDMAKRALLEPGYWNNSSTSAGNHPVLRYLHDC